MTKKIVLLRYSLAVFLLFCFGKPATIQHTPELISRTPPMEKPENTALSIDSLLKPYLSIDLNTTFILPVNINFYRKTILTADTNSLQLAAEFRYTRAYSVFAPCTGIVQQSGKEAAGYFIELTCPVLENARLHTVHFRLSHLDTLFPHENKLQAGTLISRSKNPQINIYCPDKEFPLYRPYEDPLDFIRSHSQMVKPSVEKLMVIAVKHLYSFCLVKQGILSERIEMALGQVPEGHKQREGDNHTPEGEYRITHKAKGPFGGGIGAYLGTAWMEISYPNRFDARNGYKRGIISPSDEKQIIQHDLQKKRAPAHTKLGGLVGLHGWNGTWSEDYRHITWGCISLQNADIDRIFSRLPVNTCVLILP